MEILRKASLGWMLCVLLVSTSMAQGTSNAKQKLHNLRSKLAASRASKDWHGSLEESQELKVFLNELPDTLIEVARANVRIGDPKAAIRNLQQFVRMGQWVEISQLPDLMPLSKDRQFTTIRAGLTANSTPVSSASTAFVLSDSNLLAEDLDFDAATKRFFVTSVRERKIVTVDASGRLADFANSPDSWSIFAIKIDALHRLVWATEVALEGYIFAPEQDWGRSAVLCYDLQTGQLLRRVEGPRGGELGDMVLGPNSDVIVSDGQGGGIYRLTREGNALERLDRGDFVSPQTPVMHPDGKRLFVPDYLRGIGLLDIATGQVKWLSTQERFALGGIDGLYFDRSTLIAVQNGTSPERVEGFRLNRKLTAIEAETTIERATRTLGDPTHGVVVGSDFYYIANSGWDQIDGHGNLKDASEQLPSRIMQARFQSLIWR